VTAVTLASAGADKVIEMDFVTMNERKHRGKCWK
jgi:hypothetical protein